jgi:hypothetical protein
MVGIAHACQNMFVLRVSSVSARISKGQGAVSAKKGNLRRSTEKR